MSPKRKIRRWLKSGIIDTITANKILAFEENRLTTLYRKIALILGLLLFISSLFLFGSLLQDDFPIQFKSIAELVAIAFLISGIFLLLTKKLKFSRKDYLHSLFVFIFGSIIIFVYSIFETTAPTGSLAEWILLASVSLSIGKRRPKYALYSFLIYSVTCYLIKNFTIQFFGIEPNPWLVASAIILPAILVVLKLLIQEFPKFVEYLKKTKFNAIIKLFKKWWEKYSPKILKLVQWLGPARLILLLVLMGALCFYVISFLFLSEDHVKNEALEAFIFYGICILFLSFTKKELPPFSALFTGLAWIEILIGHTHFVNGKIKVVYESFQLSLGKLIISSVILFSLYLTTKTIAQKKIKVSDILPLGPIGYISAAILMSLIL